MRRIGFAAVGLVAAFAIATLWLGGCGEEPGEDTLGSATAASTAEGVAPEGPGCGCDHAGAADDCGCGRAGKKGFVDENGDGICDHMADGGCRCGHHGAAGDCGCGGEAGGCGCGHAGKRAFVDEDGDGICDHRGAAPCPCGSH
jgi:hypothetical protein